MKYRWLLDFGHGGIDPNTGNYVNASTKMYDHGDFKIYEGVINRAIGLRLYSRLQVAGIRSQIINEIDDIYEDISLLSRVSYANSIYKFDPTSIFISIHSNAGGGHGNEIWTSVGQTKSDQIAQIFSDIYQEEFPEFRFRKDTIDGDDDKERNFFVLRKTNGPALLLENLFFDNKNEAKYLMSVEGQERFAGVIFKCIIYVEKLMPI